MNQRIEELWDKAAQEAAAYPSGQNNSWETQVKFMEKFAELIVRECSLMCLEDKDSQRILKHFGVDNNSIKVGSRIKVVSKFNVGARGTVTYIEPIGKLWVRRDGASSDVFYYPEEVIGVDQ